MKISEEIKFGITFIILFLILISYFFYIKSYTPIYFLVPIIISISISIFINKLLLKYLMEKWMRFAILISKVMNPIIMCLIYITTVVPIGLFMRIFRVDSLKLKKNNNKTYWQNRENNIPNDMNDQF
jgi:hypothetical protein